MSKEEIKAQIAQLLLRREDLRIEIRAITKELKERARSFTTVADRLSREPASVRIDNDAIYLTRQNEREPVVQVPTAHFDLQKLDALTRDLRDRQSVLDETQQYLAAQGYGS